MRTSKWAVAVGVVLLAGGTARADEAERLKALVDEAIKAKGGEARLVDLQAAVWKSRGTGRPSSLAKSLQLLCIINRAAVARFASCTNCLAKSIGIAAQAAKFASLRRTSMDLMPAECGSWNGRAPSAIC